MENYFTVPFYYVSSRTLHAILAWSIAVCTGVRIVRSIVKGKAALQTAVLFQWPSSTHHRCKKWTWPRIMLPRPRMKLQRPFQSSTNQHTAYQCKIIFKLSRRFNYSVKVRPSCMSSRHIYMVMVCSGESIAIHTNDHFTLRIYFFIDFQKTISQIVPHVFVEHLLSRQGDVCV